MAGALRLDFGTLVAAAVPPLRASDGPSGDALAARAMASVGLAAILCLPVLLLASLVLAAPLAVPAAIASFYLAISHALASKRPQRAALISAIVLAALVGWVVAYLVAGEAPFSRTGIAAVLLAPLFAAAPAMARSIIAPRPPSVNQAGASSRDAAQKSTDCLDALAPSEAVLIVDREGCVLAATRAARKRLRLFPDAFDTPVTSLFDPADMGRLADAFQDCRVRGEPVAFEAETPGEAGEGREQWVLSPGEGGAVSLRRAGCAPVARAEPDGAKAASEPENMAHSAPVVAPCCDLGEALVFALRHASARAEMRATTLTSECDPDLHVACDRPLGRRIAHLAIESALGETEGGVIRVDARRLRGIVLLRVAVEYARDRDLAAVGEDDPSKLATLKALVEDAGGTLIVDGRTGGRTLSIRLARTELETMKRRTKERAEAD